MAIDKNKAAVDSLVNSLRQADISISDNAKELIANAKLTSNQLQSLANSLMQSGKKITAGNIEKYLSQVQAVVEETTKHSQGLLSWTKAQEKQAKLIAEAEDKKLKLVLEDLKAREDGLKVTKELTIKERKQLSQSYGNITTPSILRSSNNKPSGSATNALVIYQDDIQQAKNVQNAINRGRVVTRINTNRNIADFSYSGMKNLSMASEAIRARNEQLKNRYINSISSLALSRPLRTLETNSASANIRREQEMQERKERIRNSIEFSRGLGRPLHQLDIAHRRSQLEHARELAQSRPLALLSQAESDILARKQKRKDDIRKRIEANRALGRPLASLTEAENNILSAKDTPKDTNGSANSFLNQEKENKARNRENSFLGKLLDGIGKLLKRNSVLGDLIKTAILYLGKSHPVLAALLLTTRLLGAATIANTAAVIANTLSRTFGFGRGLFKGSANIFNPAGVRASHRHAAVMYQRYAKVGKNERALSRTADGLYRVNSLSGPQGKRALYYYNQAKVLEVIRGIQNLPNKFKILSPAGFTRAGRQTYAGAQKLFDKPFFMMGNSLKAVKGLEGFGNALLGIVKITPKLLKGSVVLAVIGLALDTVISIFKNSGATVRAIGRFGSAIGLLIKGLWGAVKAIGRIIGNILTTVGNAIQWVSNALGLTTALDKIGKAVNWALKGLIDGISNLIFWIDKKITELKIKHPKIAEALGMDTSTIPSDLARQEDEERKKKRENANNELNSLREKYIDKYAQEKAAQEHSLNWAKRWNSEQQYKNSDEFRKSAEAQAYADKMLAQDKRAIELKKTITDSDTVAELVKKNTAARISKNDLYNKSPEEIAKMAASSSAYEALTDRKGYWTISRKDFAKYSGNAAGGAGNGDVLFTAAGFQDTLQTLVDKYGMPRNFEITSGLRSKDSVHDGHTLGEVDITYANPADRALADAALKKARNDGAIGFFQNEYDKKSRKSTGGHIHVAPQAYGVQVAKEVAEGTYKAVEETTANVTKKEAGALDPALISRIGDLSSRDKTRALIFSATDITGSLGVWGITQTNNDGGSMRVGK